MILLKIIVASLFFKSVFGPLKVAFGREIFDDTFNLSFRRGYKEKQKKSRIMSKNKAKMLVLILFHLSKLNVL